MPQPKSNDISEMTNHFFPDNAPLPLEIHGLDSTKATVKGFCDGDELLVSVDDNSQIWVRLVDGGTHESTSLFLAPEKAAAIGNAFLRFAELARERTIGADRLKQTLGMED